MVFGFNICSGYEYHCLGSTIWILNYALTSHPTCSFWAFQWRSVVVCCTHRPLLDCLYVQHLYTKQCAAFHAPMMPVFLPWVATGMLFFFGRWEGNDVAPPRTMEFIHLLWETFARIHPFLNTWLENFQLVLENMSINWNKNSESISENASCNSLTNIKCQILNDIACLG